MTLPAYAFGDPADVVEQKQLREMGCRACSHHVVHFGRVMCTSPKVVSQKRVPNIGSRCKWFNLKG